MSDPKITQDLIIIDGAAHNPNDVVEAAKTWVRLFKPQSEPVVVMPTAWGNKGLAFPGSWD